MTKEDLYQRMTEIIEKIPNGVERFRTSAMLNKAVNAIARGEDPILIIDTIITGFEQLQSEFENYVNTDCRPIFMNNLPST